MLFRQEALKARATKLYGDVIIINQLSFKILSLLLIACVLFACIFTIMGSYARTQSVLGYIVPSKGLVRVYPSQFGVLRDFNVTEGQSIKSGQILGSIAIEKAAQNANTPEAILLKFIKNQKQNLNLQIEQEVEKYKIEFKQNKHAVLKIDEEVNALGEQLNIQNAILNAAEQNFKSQQKLFKKGHISQAALLQNKAELLIQKRQTKQYAQNVSALKAQKQRLADVVELMPKRHNATITQMKSHLVELDKQRSELDGARVFEIKAPIDGRASAISAVNGRTVSQNKSIISILPKDSLLEAELLIPSRAIGFIKLGQEVRLLYDAFPYQRFGSHKGVIKSIAASIMLPKESDAPISIKEPVYKVVVELQSDYVEAYGQRYAIQTGMLLNANVILERRTFLDWILDPLRAVGRRS